MRKCEYVEISRDIIYADFYKHIGCMQLLVYLLLERDCDTNSCIASCKRLSLATGQDEGNIKKCLSRLKDDGFLELYRRDKTSKEMIIALRRADEYYRIGEFELFLSENEVVNISKGRTERGYAKFRSSVLKRDNYACQHCGSKENLEVHHKKSYAKHPRLRTTVSNGITLCRLCHREIHRKRALS